MTFDARLSSMLEDTVTIEPFVSETAGRVASHGPAVTYAAQVVLGAKRLVRPDGKEIVSNVQVIIPGRIFVDPRSRLTLPAGFVPNQPPILGVHTYKGLGMDSTTVMC